MLITGVTGFLGRFIVREILRRYDKNIFCLVRGHKRVSAVERLEKTLRTVGVKSLDNIQIIEGDLKNIPSKVNAKAILHCAGDVRFRNSFEKDIMQTNLDGTEAMLALASRSNIHNFHFVSTAFARDFMKNGIVAEISKCGEFVNPYICSKILAEKKVLKWAFKKSQRRAFIYAPSIVVGSLADNGFCSSMNSGWYRFMEVFWRLKKISRSSQFSVAVPGDKDASINIVTIDYVAKLIVDLMEANREGCFNITNGNPPKFESLLQMGLESLGISGPSVLRNPKDCRSKKMKLLQMAISRGIRDYRPFISYNPQFSQENCKKALGSAFEEHPPITQEDVNLLLRFAVRSKFGKNNPTSW